MAVARTFVRLQRSEQLFVDGWSQPVTHSQAQGDFSFEDVSPRVYRLSLEHSDYTGLVMLDSIEVREEVNPPAVIVQIDGGLSIAGFVVNPKGMPSVGAQVRLRTIKVSSALGNEERTATTGSAGRFRFEGLHEGSYHLAERRGEALKHGMGIVLRGAGNAEVILQNAGGASLEVLVRCGGDLGEINLFDDVPHRNAERSGGPAFP